MAAHRYQQLTRAAGTFARENRRAGSGEVRRAFEKDGRRYSPEAIKGALLAAGWNETFGPGFDRPADSPERAREAEARAAAAARADRVDAAGFPLERVGIREAPPGRRIRRAADNPDGGTRHDALAAKVASPPDAVSPVRRVASDSPRCHDEGVDSENTRRALTGALNRAVPDLRLAMLFGSFATGRTHFDSDVDLGLLREGRPLSREDVLRVGRRVGEVTGFPAHVVDLHPVPHPVTWSALSGVRLIGSDEAYADLCTRYVMDYEDFGRLRAQLMDEELDRWLGR